MRYFWLTLSVAGKKKLKKVAMIASATKVFTLELMSKLFFEADVLAFEETTESGL